LTETYLHVTSKANAKRNIQLHLQKKTAVDHPFSDGQRK